MPEGDLVRFVDGMQVRLARAQGRRDALAERRKALEREVGLAKGRQALKARVEDFLHGLQDDASRRTVANYETLLNALCSEVFPDQAAEDRRIVLDLGAERGMPSLDVLIESGGRVDEREDVLEDNGGALTNVVSLGLRLIAAVKSGTGKFLVLDEPDCWIEGNRVVPFYGVLKSAADRLGIQCLAISHHDVLSRLDGIHVARLTGFPKKGGVKVVGDSPAWPDDRPGFRHVRLVDVQGYVDETFRLAPGVTTLTGPNGRGKSTMTRAWRAVFYGEAKVSLIRHGAKTATIEVGLRGGRVLRYVRARKSPVNAWSLHDAGGAVVEEDGERFEAGGNVVPEWVGRLFGLSRVDGLDVHLSHQKHPVFLLGETAAKRASVLSVGQEAAYVQDMLAVHRERSNKDAQTVRDGEREVAQVASGERALAALPEVAVALSSLREAAATVERESSAVLAMSAAADALEETGLRLASVRARSEAYASLPAASEEPAVAKAIAGTERLDALAARLGVVEAGLAEIRSRSLALFDLPSPQALDGLLRRARALDESARVHGSVEAAGKAVLGSKARADALAALPVREPDVDDTETLKETGAAVRRCLVALHASRAREEVLRDLPSLPAAGPTDAMEQAAALMERALSSKAEADARRFRADDESEALRREVEGILADAGGRCAACGQSVADATVLLEAHA